MNWDLKNGITFAAYVEHWKKDIMPEKLSVSTQRRAQQDLQRILPELGRVRLTELDRPKVREFCNKMRKSPSAKGGIISERTVSGIHSTLCGILSDAVEEGYIRDNPAWRAFKPKTKRKDIYAVDEEQARQLIEELEQCSIKHETFYKLVLATGMHHGEACGLPPQLTIHSLRHTCASLQIAHGVDVRTVASNLGHSQTSTTLDIYAHAFDKQRRESQKTLEDVLGI